MKHTKKREKINNQGLTLIELIVTIAIIGIFGVVVMSFVTSGANFYRQASDTSTVQRSMQMTLDQIENLVIDTNKSISYSVGGQATQSDLGSQDSQEKILILESVQGENTQHKEILKWNPDENPDEEIQNPSDEFLENMEFTEAVPQETIIDGYTKEEKEKAITETNAEIRTVKLDIKSSDLKIAQIEKELENQEVKSTINGVVKKVGDKGQTDGEAFLEIQSTQGIYVKGMVDEYQREKLKVGSQISGTAYESGVSFEAEVKEISTYPVSSNYSNSNNSALSYYSFTAYIQDVQGLKNQEAVSMELPAEEMDASGIYLNREYVREKDGEDFVYKEENGKLVKQPVKTGKIFYGMVEIKSGITEEDFIAFPYGKKVKEGASVKETSAEDAYNMYGGLG